MAALDVVYDEKLMQNARRLGEIFRSEMQRMVDTYDVLKLVRGKGLLNAVVINAGPIQFDGVGPVCARWQSADFLAKPTHGNIIRFAPPLVMTEEQLRDCLSIIEQTVQSVHGLTAYQRAIERARFLHSLMSSGGPLDFQGSGPPHDPADQLGGDRYIHLQRHATVTMLLDLL